MSADDTRWMRRALELAARGIETTTPNPRVGCVLVRDGRVVGEGWHERAGEAHAEVRALQAAGADAAGATAYVSLEPCNHFGRTPPCVDALIAARVRRVVYAMQDPNPQVDGSGADRLRAAGIAVESEVLANDAELLNIGFAHRMRTGRPWVRLKTAATLDGRTALSSGESRWITGEEARADVHALRAESSAVLTGIGTVLADDPRLDVRRDSPVLRQPDRVVIDGRLRTPLTATLFDSGDAASTVWIFTHSNDRDAAERLEARGARVELMPEWSGKVDLSAVMERLGELEMNDVLVEAGATLAGALLSQNLVDEWVHYLAPTLLGFAARRLADVPQPESMDRAQRFELIDTLVLGSDVKLRLIPRKG